jgi:hypothetical protein
MPYVSEERKKRIFRKWAGQGDMTESLARAMGSLIDLYFFVLQLEACTRSVKQKGGEGG